MSYPGVTINVENGNLLRAIAIGDGLGAIVATVATPSLVGEAKQVFGLQDAESKGYTAGDEPFAHGLIKQFYDELGGNQRLYVFGTAETATMTDVVTATNPLGLSKLLTAGGGNINLVAIARKPAAGYNAGGNFLDADVSSAVLASRAICGVWQGKNSPVRLLFEGRVANEGVDNTFSPSAAENGFVGVVLGGTEPDGSAAVALALARACKYGAHVKLGSGRNGALTASQIYIGSKPIEERLDVEILHDAGFITFHHRPGIAGYYFGVDKMCESGDYRILVHGRVIDKAQRIAAAAYTPYVEDFIRVETDGTPNSTDTKHLEDILLSAIRANMEGQISNAAVLIDPAQNAGIVETSTLQVNVKILPLGYLTWINVTLGLTANIQQ